MKIEKIDLSRIIKESLSDEAYEAGYNDALRDRPHGSNPDMRDLDSRAYDHGFDKGTAERMDLQRPLGTRGFHESKTITGTTVKITKRQLKRIIAEEKQKLNEGSIDDAAREMAKLIDQIGALPFARATLDALGDEATEKGWSIVNWVKRQYGLKDSAPSPESRRRGTSRFGMGPRR